MASLKVGGNELENNDNGVINGLSTNQKQILLEVKKTEQSDLNNGNTGPLQKVNEKSAVLKERLAVGSMKLGESTRAVVEGTLTRLPSTSNTFSMSHSQNPSRKQDISFGNAPVSYSTFPSAAPPVPVSLINPANPSASIESNHRDYIQRLLSMTPIELSKHAVELENRSMQITRAANREITRKAALNINLSQPASKREQETANSTK